MVLFKILEDPFVSFTKICGFKIVLSWFAMLFVLLQVENKSSVKSEKSMLGGGWRGTVRLNKHRTLFQQTPASVLNLKSMVSCFSSLA